MNSGNVSQSHGRPSTMTTPGMSSTPAMHVDEHVVVLCAARREADAAVAHHRGGHAVMRRRRHPVRPDRLAVVVGVQVDEARSDQKPRRVDFPDGVAADRPDRGDHAVLTATSPT